MPIGTKFREPVEGETKSLFKVVYPPIVTFPPVGAISTAPLGISLIITLLLSFPPLI